MGPTFRPNDDPFAGPPLGDVALGERMFLAVLRFTSDGFLPASVAGADTRLFDVRRSLDELGADPLASELDARAIATSEENHRQEAGQDRLGGVPAVPVPKLGD